MGSSVISPTTPSAAFVHAFRARAGIGGALSFADFMDLALYDPSVGYYRRAGTRVGYGKGTDFFTASTSGPIFGELVVAAVSSLLRGQNLRDFTFVEMGAEDGDGILAEVAHPFGAARTIRVGDPIALSGRLVVFSNELFDARPFRRFVFRQGRWKEFFVEDRDGKGILAEIERDAESPAILPVGTPEGYVIDAPLAATALATQIASQPWTGLFVAADYGKSWAELTSATPAGTARAYHQHAQSNDLLARPGEQDLTCHICWDWLQDALEHQGFSRLQLESQEAFFIRHAGEFIGAITVAEAAKFSQKKLSLMQLLHPSHLGQKFQVLHGPRF